MSDERRGAAGGMDRIVICRCEDVSLEEIADTARVHQCSAREVKLRTRAAMGYCGGRTCRPAVDAIVRAFAGNQAEREIPLKIQTPVRPIALFELRGGGEQDE